MALDSLLGLTGLWPAFHIGTMRRYLILRCHEVVTNALYRGIAANKAKELTEYLCHIRRTWDTIMGADPRYSLDAATVRELELRAPGISEDDATFVRTQMECRALFRSISDIIERQKLLDNILSITRRIPSLATFCEDTKYLEPCASAMKRLLEPKFKGTIYQAMRNIFSSTGCQPRTFLRQDSDHQLHPVQGLETDRFKFSYRQLWVYAFRLFPELVNVAPRKEPDQPKPVVKEPSALAWHRFAELAWKMGFNSKQIQLLVSDNALEKEIRQFLLRVSPNTSSEETIQRQLKDIYQSLESNQREPSRLLDPVLTTDDCNQDLQHRCGRPFENSQELAKESIYLRSLYEINESRGKYITSFFVKRDTFQAFLGYEAIHIEPQCNPSPLRECFQASNDTASLKPAEDVLDIEIDHPQETTANQVSTDMEWKRNIIFVDNTDGKREEVELDPEKILELATSYAARNLRIFYKPKGSGKKAFITADCCFEKAMAAGVSQFWCEAAQKSASARPNKVMKPIPSKKLQKNLEHGVPTKFMLGRSTPEDEDQL